MVEREENAATIEMLEKFARGLKADPAAVGKKGPIERQRRAQTSTVFINH
jgi:hypothetical protein